MTEPNWSAMTLTDIRAVLEMLREPVCDLCGRSLLWCELELHHIYGRDRGNPLMNHACNLVFICRRFCHKPGGLGWENRCYLAELQRARGYDLEAWRDGLDWRIPIIFPWEGTYGAR